MRITWGRVDQSWFVDEPGLPNVVAWRRFEVRLRVGDRSWLLWRGPRRWVVRNPEEAAAALGLDLDRHWMRLFDARMN